ncbi:hypothetical protein, partial [Escherichia coli]|uniref:hypothetical protein n=1 Tax=Escherichia coli TaxID=562 RepID=UPI001BC8A7AC
KFHNAEWRNFLGFPLTPPIEARNAEIVSLRADYAGRDSEELKSIVRSNGFLSSSSIEKAVALRILDERGDASEFRPLKGD